MSFDNPAGAGEIAWLGRGLPRLLETGLAQTPGLDVISSERVGEILKELGTTTIDRLDSDRVLDVARRAGAGALVSGSLFEAGSAVRVDAQVQDVATGRFLGAYTVTGSDVFAVADELTTHILGGLNISSSRPPAGVADVTTGSLEAYRLYTEGLDALVNVRRTDARRLFEKAVEIDPEFAAAYQRLIATTQQLGDTAASEAYRRKTLQYIDRLSERDRLLMEAQEARVNGDAEQAALRFEQVIQKYPDTELAYFGLSFVQRDVLGTPEQALATMERGVKALPASPGMRNLYGYNLLYSSRFAEAIRQFEEYIRLRPREPNAYDSLAEAYLTSGQPERAIERYARALEIQPDFCISHHGRAFALTTVGRYEEAFGEEAKHEHCTRAAGAPSAASDLAVAFMLSRVGRYRHAARRTADGIAAAERLRNFGFVAAFRVMDGFIAIERGDYDGALRHAAALDTARGLTNNSPLEAELSMLDALLTGVAHARSGRIDQARAEHEAHMGAGQGVDYHKWWSRALSGEIALATGDATGAERAFADGEPILKMYFSLNFLPRTLFANNLPLRDGVARAQAARADLTAAIESYQRLLTLDLGSKWTAMLEPRYVLALARLQEKSGDHAGARQQYQRFVDLWKNADAGLPELGEARAALKRL